MKGELVPFELAKKLKEKGYPQNFSRRKSIIAPSYHYYNSKGLVDGAVDDDGFVAYASAPLIFQVLKWLREKKKIHVGIGVTPRSLWRYVIMFCDDRGFEEPTITEKNHSTYEEAAIAGIEYTLDNLI